MLQSRSERNSEKILITGGAGFIGTVISTLALEAGYSVKAVDLLWFNQEIPASLTANPNFSFVKKDIRQIKLMDDVLKDVDFIIHTAAVVGEPASKKFPDLTHDINFKASIELISKAIEYGVKGFVFFSTCSNYGISDGVVNEKMLLKPLSLYAKTKVDVEKFLMDNNANLDWVICRLSTVYGCSPRMRFDLTVNDFTMNAYMKKYLDIFLPYSFRPYIHVSDVANVIIELIKNFDKVKNDVFNIGFHGENYQKIEIADIVKKFVPDTKIEIVKKGMDLRDYQVDFSKLQKSLNIKNNFTVQDGVKEVLKLLENKTIADPYQNCYYNTTPAFEA